MSSDATDVRDQRAGEAADQDVIDLTTFLQEAEAFLDGSLGGRKDLAATDSTMVSRALYRGATGGEVEAACDWQRVAFDAGFGWITGPTRWGGRGLPATFEQAYFRLEREYDVPSRGPLSISHGMVVPAVLEFGTEAAQERWLRALRRGDAVGCQLFSEPGAGSDLAAIATSAVRDGDGWRLTGQKVWTSGAHFSEVGLALARTAPGPRHRNLTAFLVDMTAPGVEVRPLRQMTGGAEFNEVFLDGVYVADDHQLGERDQGWTVAMATLMHERSAIGGAASGGSGLFKLDALLDWVQRNGGAADPQVAAAYARVYAGVTAAKWMRKRAAKVAKAGQRPGPEMSLSKLALTANLQAMSDLVSLVLGPKLLADVGEPDAWPWAEFVLGVPGMRIGGGTDEIQRNTIAERVLGLPKEPPARTDSERA